VENDAHFQALERENNNNNQILKEKELSQPNIHNALHNEEKEKKIEDDDSPILEKNDDFQGKIQDLHESQEKKNVFPKEEEKKSQIKEEEKAIRVNSRRNSQASDKNLMKQSDRAANNERIGDKNLNYRSEIVDKNSNNPNNPYNFRSMMIKKEPSPMRPAVQKLFEIEENYKIDPKKPMISNIMPRNEEKLSQIMNAKDFDRFSENSEKPKSEVFDSGDFKKENQSLKEENQDLKAKLTNMMNSYQETEGILDILRKENQMLLDKHGELGEHDEGFKKEFENQENLIEKLKHNNEILRMENQALNDHIKEREHENEKIKNNLENKANFQGQAEDFETLEMLKKENEALRTYLSENKLKEHEGEKDLLEKLMQENEQLKVNLKEMQKLKPNDGDFRGSALSRENFEFEEPRIQQNLPGGSMPTKFMSNANNNSNTKHWVKSSNNDPEEKKDVSPHKKMIFEKPMQVDTDDLKKSMEVGSDKKKRSNEASHNQSMEDTNHPRLSNYLKRSGKMSRNESQKSAHTDQNKSFEDGNEKILAGLNTQQQPRMVIKSSIPYEGPRNFEENFDTNSVLSRNL